MVKYVDSENVKTVRVNTVILNLRQVNRGIFLRHPVLSLTLSQRRHHMNYLPGILILQYLYMSVSLA